MTFATIYGLLYGNDHKLHKRFIGSLLKHVPHGTYIRLWCNTVCSATLQYLAQEQDKRMSKLIPDRSLMFFVSDDNVPKYKAMRIMFEKTWPPESKWVVWFDDDSYIDRDDWWNRTVEYIKTHPSACYIGQPWYVHHLAGQWEFIEKAEWFKGMKPEQCPTKKGKKKPGITFAQGAYWWLRTDVLKSLDWPDPRLNHNGGDTLLGEAIRQQGLPFHKFHYGVQINKAKRRGFHEKPAGADKDVRR